MTPQLRFRQDSMTKVGSWVRCECVRLDIRLIHCYVLRVSVVKFKRSLVSLEESRKSLHLTHVDMGSSMHFFRVVYLVRSTLSIKTSLC